MRRVEFRVSPWTSEDGYGAFALDSTRPHSAITPMDDTVLPSLTTEDLKDLGVIIVGHRRKLLDAITALRAGTSAKAVSPDTVPEPTKPPRTPPSAVKSPSCSATSSVRRRSRPVWIPRTCARSSRRIRHVLPVLSAGSTGSSRSTWATVFSFISVIRRRMRTTPSERSGGPRRCRRRRRPRRRIRHAASARRHRHRAGRGRRSRRRRLGAGTVGRRRDPEPRRPAASAWPSRTPSSSPRARTRLIGDSSTTAISAPSSEGHRRAGARPGRYCGRGGR